MYITCSKNASDSLISLARAMTAIEGVKYLARSKRPLDKICKIIQKHSQKEILVVAQKEDKTTILKYKSSPHGWIWDKKALAIDKLKTKKIEIEAPYIFETKADSKEIAEFFDLQDSIHAKLYDSPSKIKVEAKAKTLTIKHKKEIMLECKYEWVLCKE